VLTLGRKAVNAIALCAMALTPKVGYSEATVSLSTDLRGSITFLEDLYRPNIPRPPAGQGPSDGSQSSVTASATSGETVENFDILSAFSVGYTHELVAHQTMAAGIRGAFSYVNLKARYPDGFTISSSGRNITFIESASFILKSFDLGLGPYVSWQPSKNLRADFSILLIHQRLELSSSLGSWNLEDQLERSFVEWNSSLGYAILSDLTGDRICPTLVLALVGRPTDTTASIGLRLSF
jgi:hypothetical protein